MHQPSNSRLNNTLLLVLLLVCVQFALYGCGKANTTIRGRVITGAVGQATAAAPADQRFKEPGLPEMTVTVLARGGSAARGRGVYSEAVTDDLGDFELVFPGGSFPRDSVEIRVSGEGIFTARSTTFMPAQGDRLLCVVIPRPGYVRPDPNRKQQE